MELLTNSKLLCFCCFLIQFAVFFLPLCLHSFCFFLADRLILSANNFTQQTRLHLHAVAFAASILIVLAKVCLTLAADLTVDSLHC